MISVPNRRQLLNGSRVIYFLLAVFVLGMLTQCSTARKSQKPSGTATDPTKTKPKVYNPQSGKWEEANIENAKVDTLEWTDITDKPIESRDVHTKLPHSPLKDVYQVSLLLPMRGRYLAAEERVSVKTERFIQYYAGFMRGIKKLEREGIKLKVDILDTDESESKISTLISGDDLVHSDLIIGPYRKNNVERIIQFGKDNSIPVVTPWTSFSNLATDNPYYILTNPVYESHCDHIVQDIHDRFENPNVFLITRPDETYFADFYQSTNPENLFTNYLITDNSMDLKNTNFDSVMVRDEKNVIILPFFSNRDRQFIYTILRKLSILNNEFDIHIYGLPILKSLVETDSDLFNTVNVYISESGYLRDQSTDYLDIHRHMLKEYGTVPGEDALEAFDTIVFMGRMLAKHGKNFQFYFDQDTYLDPMYKSFKFQAKYRNPEVRDDYAQIQYFENNFLELIQLKDFKFTKVY